MDMQILLRNHLAHEHVSYPICLNPGHSERKILINIYIYIFKWYLREIQMAPSLTLMY